jgi:hypothetical protein
MSASRSVFCFWASIAVSSLEICTVLYVDNIRAAVAAMKVADVPVHEEGLLEGLERV